jgi:two-component system CheB/CheR fusion protein
MSQIDLKDCEADAGGKGGPDGYIVAIGASAGGLDALERFFSALPTDSGAAYVVIQHLSPDHKSMMVNLLGRHTQMPVVTVEDGMAMMPDRVHLIPPATIMHVVQGHLRLTPKSSRVLTLPIDLFFTSLAKDAGHRAVAVVLSGTGSDGTRGSVAINEAGGLLLAQDPETAKFDGMPRSVIATGLVDGILEPEELAQRVLEHIRQAPRAPTGRRARERLAAATDSDSALDEIQHLLRNVGGIDFRDYKPATVLRRIERRMKVRHVPSYEHYAQLLDGDRTELANLRRELLIPVTNFFRDTEAFDYLAEAAIASLVKERRDGQPLRVWIAGAATGEEAYSLAILFAEACERERRWPDFKIFATDVEQQCIDAAGAGVFPEAISAEVSPERLQRFFAHRGNHFVVKPDLRQNIIFARHNLLADPPFTRMDLVSCRNVLIYFQPEAQERVMRRLQYALAPGGFLFLGSSESLGGVAADFSPVSSKHKLFRVLRHIALPLDATTVGLPRASPARHRHGGRMSAGPSDAAAIEAGLAALLRIYAPASLLLSRSHELLHVFGDVTRYLRIGEGSATLDVAKLLPERLAPVALALLHKAAKDTGPLRSEVLTLPVEGDAPLRLRLLARPIEVPQGETHLLLSFEPEPVETAEPSTAVETVDLSHETNQRVRSLEQELDATRDSLQATIEELETANEELQATNEELMASNEELQSANEELQSVNEELYTVNAEHQENIGILNRLNADLDNLAKAVAIATLFVDGELRITRFTPEATQLFNIRDADIGRPIADFTNRLDHPELVAELRETVRRGRPLQHEIRAADGRIYLTRILPYELPKRETRGAVATFVDITNLHDHECLQSALAALPGPSIVLDAEGRIAMANEAWREQVLEAARNGHEGGGRPVQGQPGASYLDACRTLSDTQGGGFGHIADRLAALLRGELDALQLGGPAGDGRRLLCHAVPLRRAEGGAILTFIDLGAVASDAP